MSHSLSDRRVVPIAVALFAVALILRLLASLWGLPNDVRNWSLHVDEPVLYLKYVGSLSPAEGKFVTSEYSYPTLYPLLLRIVGDSAASITGVQDPSLANSAASQQDRATMLRDHMTLFHRVGRTINALAGAGTAVVLFLLMLRFVGLFGGLASGALLAVAPGHVLLSRFQTVDVFATFLFALAILWSVKAWESESTTAFLRAAIVAGVCVGLATGAKYTGFASFGALIPALWMRRQLGVVSAAPLSVAAAGVAFLLSTPGVFLDFGSVREGLRLEAAHATGGHGLVFVNTPSGYLFHLGNVALILGFGASLIGAGGLAVAIWRRERWVWFVLAAVLPYFAVVGFTEVKLLRYALPMAVAAACGFGYAIMLLRKRMPALAYAALALAIIGLDGQFSGVVGTARLTAWMSSPDPRDEAGRLLRQRAAANPDTLLALVQTPWFWTASVDPNLSQMFYQEPEQVQAYLAQTAQPKIVFGTAERQPDYVVFSGFEVDDVRRLRSATNLKPGMAAYVRSQNEFLDQLERSYVVEQEFGGGAPDSEDIRYVRPTVTVLRRRELQP